MLRRCGTPLSRRLARLHPLDSDFGIFTRVFARKFLKQLRSDFHFGYSADLAREGHYLLRTNLTEHAPALLWQFYIQLTEVEQAFKELKNDLAIRPIYHQKDERIEARIFVSFLAYCLQVTLKARLKPLASGLTPRAVLEKFAAVQMLDVHLPTTDGRELVLTRHTEPDADLRLLLAHMKLSLPAQPPPRIRISRTPSIAAALPL